MEKTEFDFAAKLAELEAITAWFESSDVDLAEALVKFERGMELAAKLKDHLQVIENKVVKIKQQFDMPGKSDSVREEDVLDSPDGSLDLFGSD